MYKCPYCNHTLETKTLKQGLYGRCFYCRFAGYIPKIRPEEAKIEPEEAKIEPEEAKIEPEEAKIGLDKVSDEERRELKEWLNKIRKKHKIKGPIPGKIVLKELELEKKAEKSKRT